MTTLGYSAAILFDLDGTLMDDDRAVEAATKSFHSVYGKTLGLSIQDFDRRWKELLKFHLDRYIAGELSMLEQRRARIRDLFAPSGSPMNTVKADEIFGVYEYYYHEAWVAFPDAAIVLPTLKQYRLAVLTNGDLSQQTQKLRIAGLSDFFCSIFASSEIGLAKPRTEAFLYACHQLQLDPANCAYVGDDLEVDARGSVAAGLIGIWLDRSGLGRAPDNRIRVIHSLAGLHASLASGGPCLFSVTTDECRTTDLPMDRPVVVDHSERRERKTIKESTKVQQRYYIIRGGIEGRERLRVMARVLRPATLALLDRVGIHPGMACLDIGCGGGDVSLDLARLVGDDGRVVGIDRDQVKIELAREEAANAFTNVEFRVADILDHDFAGEFDLVYVRFVLTHLPDPSAALRRIRDVLRPGGILVVVDIDFRGCFSYPENTAFHRYVDLYTLLAQRRGGDPHIGPRLPELLVRNGFDQIQFNIVQPAGLEGEVKLLTPITMENMADSLVADGLASKDEVDSLTNELYEYARTPGTIGTTPRIVEAWGRKPTPSAELERSS